MNYLQTSTDASGKPVNIRYNDYGAGKPVILISGWPLSKEMWEYQINDLVNSGHRVIAYDRRGFGQSSQPWDGYDYDTLTDDLKSLIDQLKLEDITLIGFSMGGGEVVRYFSRHGGKGVTKVVLISSIAPYMLKTETNPAGEPKEAFDDMIEQITHDRIGFMNEFVKTFFGMSMFNNPLSSSLLEYYRMLCSIASPRATTECIKSFSTTDFTAEMDLITVPTLIIHGADDKNVPLDATSYKASKLIPDNSFIIYEGAPHGLFYTERNKLNADLLKFLSNGGRALFANAEHKEEGAYLAEK
ncbi:MAG TPA: alpha/beta hydrolase [Cyclobacteriaceae bacterium]|jgi:pimeloyl-ACP methyl ester carboxylesterase|nr:alpha/beta hydrolase [Cyclobacteriaceae bacterium]